MNIPDGILCSKTDEYILEDGDYCYIGVTDIFIESVGDVIFVELPEVGSVYAKKEVFATIESAGAARELYMPVEGRVIEVNPAAAENPSILNEEPMTDGWLVKIEPSNLQSDSYDLSEYSDYADEVL